MKSGPSRLPDRLRNVSTPTQTQTATKSPRTTAIARAFTSVGLSLTTQTVSAQATAPAAPMAIVEPSDDPRVTPRVAGSETTCPAPTLANRSSRPPGACRDHPALRVENPCSAALSAWSIGFASTTTIPGSALEHPYLLMIVAHALRAVNPGASPQQTLASRKRSRYATGPCESKTSRRGRSSTA